MRGYGRQTQQGPGFDRSRPPRRTTRAGTAYQMPRTYALPSARISGSPRRELGAVHRRGKWCPRRRKQRPPRPRPRRIIATGVHAAEPTEKFSGDENRGNVRRKRRVVEVKRQECRRGFARSPPFIRSVRRVSSGAVMSGDCRGAKRRPHRSLLTLLAVQVNIRAQYSLVLLN